MRRHCSHLKGQGDAWNLGESQADWPVLGLNARDEHFMGAIEGITTFPHGYWWQQIEIRDAIPALFIALEISLVALITAIGNAAQL